MLAAVRALFLYQYQTPNAAAATSAKVSTFSLLLTGYPPVLLLLLCWVPNQ